MVLTAVLTVVAAVIGASYLVPPISAADVLAAAVMLATAAFLARMFPRFRSIYKSGR